MWRLHCIKKMLTAALLLCIAAVPAWGIVIEAEPELQAIMGDLHTLALALRMYHEKTGENRCPALEQLTGQLEKPSDPALRENVRLVGTKDAWWVGRRVPDYSRARPFLRARAGLFGLYEEDCKGLWLGGPFVWMKALSFEGEKKSARAVFPDIRVAAGTEKDARYLFFSSPETDYFWWSDLTFIPSARHAALEKFGTNLSGPFVVPPAPETPAENLQASPVSLPPKFRVGPDDEEYPAGVEMGDMIFSPVPRVRGNDR
ncbi:MAG: hypothetical protein LBR61_02530 [Synergistaceae bacterium]|jgi:hypothetical protein|nr:hypothetical protein [Synergistaceae bacterium]